MRFITLRVVPTMHIVTPKITMNQASHFFLTSPSFPLVALHLILSQHSIHQIHQSRDGKHDQGAKEGSIQTNHDLHLRHENGDGDGRQQHADGRAMINPPHHSYAKRSESLWNSLREQKSEWRLVRTAKYAMGKW